MKLFKQFTLEASHQLPNEPADVYGQCRRLHGHSYLVEIGVRGRVSPQGWIVNLADISKIFDETIKASCDHRHLNDVYPEMITTVENLGLEWAKVVRAAIKERFGAQDVDLDYLEVWETRKAGVRIEISDLLGDGILEK